MRIIKLFILLLPLFFYNCAAIEKNRINKNDNKIYYSSNGFALIYDESFYINNVVNKKINNENLIILHNTLKTGTRIRITNTYNSKYLETKIHYKANFPNIFNSVISKKVASELNLDLENPLVEIVELKKNKTFVAKEGNIFDEEKNVANKAPVESIEMSDLASNNSRKIKKKITNNKFIIVISDFFYKDSALYLKKDLENKIELSNISIKRINENKYRLLVGPFKNFNALKNTYISLNNLGFEELNIYNENNEKF